MAASPGKLRVTAQVAVFLVGFGSASSLVRRAIPWPDEYGLRAKYEYLAEHASEFDTLFLGGSVTFYGIIPPVFDQVMAERGHPTRSFNLGVGGMTALEGDHLLRRVLEQPPRPLRWVFVEAANWDARIWYTTNTYASRMAHWHTLEQTLIALRSLSRTSDPPNPDEGRLWRWKEGWIHLVLAASHYTGIGQGPRIVPALLGLDHERIEPSRAELAELHGFVDLDQAQGEEWKARRRDFLAKQDAFLGSVRDIDKGNAVTVPIDLHFNLEGLAAQMAAIRSRGAEPIFYVGPRNFPTPLEYSLAEAGVLPVLLGFNQPERYPNLYRPELRFDLNHLNRRGAEEFTRLLAEAFADRLEGRSDH